MTAATSGISQRSSDSVVDNSKPEHHLSRSKNKGDRILLALDPQRVLIFLIGFRLLNALVLQTFFQPDEYFQSLEPAWYLAFGENSAAWITWVRLLTILFEMRTDKQMYRSGRMLSDPRSILHFLPRAIISVMHW